MKDTISIKWAVDDVLSVAPHLTDDAYTLSNYISLDGLSNELDECYEVRDSGEGYEGLDNAIAVLEKAVELAMQ